MIAQQVLQAQDRVIDQPGGTPVSHGQYFSRVGAGQLQPARFHDGKRFAGQCGAPRKAQTAHGEQRGKRLASCSKGCCGHSFNGALVSGRGTR